MTKITRQESLRKVGAGDRSALNGLGVAGGLPWCLEATTATDVGKVRGGGCGELSRGIKFALDFTSIGTCVYNRATAAEGTLVTDVSGQKVVRFARVPASSI